MTQTRDYSDLFQKQCFTNWDQLMDYYQTLRSEGKQWIFRGQTNSEWDLETTLERLSRRFSIDFSELSTTECGLVRKFQRIAPLYTSTPPEKEDKMQWLALMQHHGCPTRLLDWTYSFFIATYFALETAEADSHCAIWMIDHEWLRERTKESVPDDIRSLIQNDEDLKEPETVKGLLDNSPPNSTVCRMNPFRLNERLVLQQGVFLVPGDVTRSFMDNLYKLCRPDDSQDHDSQDHFVKVILRADLAFTKEVLSELYRMNISRSTLFPGIDGFARSLGNSVMIPEVVVPFGLSHQ